MRDINFILKSDGNGVYISPIDKDGNIVNIYDKVSNFDSNTLRLLKKLREIERKTFFFDWNNLERRVYLNENIELMEYLKEVERLKNIDLESINWKKIEKDLKPKLKIFEKERGYLAKLYIDEKEEFLVLADGYILIEDEMYQTDIDTDILRLIISFKREITKDKIEEYLTLVGKYDSFLEIEFLDYTIEKKEEHIPITKELILEKITSDNSLYIKVDLKISTLSYHFLNDNNLKYGFILKKESKKIEKLELDTSFLKRAYDEIIKIVANYKRKSEYYFSEGFLILQEELAREFIEKELVKLSREFRILGTENLKRYNIKLGKPKLKIKTGSGIDFLEGDISIKIENEEISIQKILSNLKKNSYTVLSDGTNLLLDKDYMSRLERVFKIDKNKKVNVSFFDIPTLETLLDNEIVSERFEHSKEFYNGLNSLSNKNSNLPKVKAKLREYQVYGYNWLQHLSKYGLGGCLADDMGLGKTLQAITLISGFYESNKKKILIVMPKTLLYNWENEIRKFNPDLDYAIYYGTYRDSNLLQNTDVIITTYGTVRSDIEIFKEIKFNLIILDESQNIKNINSLTTKAILLLKGEQRVALSGTPIENNLIELYSLFRFLNPTMFGTINDFHKTYLLPIQKERDEIVFKELKKRIYPFILRREKKEVLKELPEKVEKILFVEMSEEQKRVYEERRAFYYKKLNTQVAKEGIGKSQFHILQALSELRIITSCPELNNSNLYSAKIDVLLHKIEEGIANGHKILIFTNYIKAIETITNELEKRGIDCLKMSGSTKNRQELVDKFQTEDRYKVFVMSLKTGGVGLNLTSADMIFIYDPWWNRTAENQAVDRAYRLGQNKTVFSYKLILKDTVEEKILKLQDKKVELLEGLISDEGTALKHLTKKDIEFIFGK